MQRAIIILAYFFVCTNTSAQQYPFVHYTPKDGLISNQVKNIYQDSKGRMYFLTFGGLSVYDGTRFYNYTSHNGLENDIVNCVMEMGNDSVWIVTNTGRIQCLANGKLKPVSVTETPQLIDNIIRDESNALYAASENGLYLFQKNRFERLPFVDRNGKDINSYIANIYPAGKYLLIVRDNSLVKTPEEKFKLYLYDKEARKIIAQAENKEIHFVTRAPDGRIWVSTTKNIFSIDTAELGNGKIVFEKLPPLFNKIENSANVFISFDQLGNCWFTDKVFTLKKLNSDGRLTVFSKASGLASLDISRVFCDKEGTTWIASYNAGIDKLVNSNFSIYENVSGVSAINAIAYVADKDQILLYSPRSKKAITIGANDRIRVFEVNEANKFYSLIASPKGFFGFSGDAIYNLNVAGSRVYPKLIRYNTVDISLGNPFVDNNGNLIFCSTEHLNVVFDKKTIYKKKISYYGDHAAMDSFGNIWQATRLGELSMYRPDPANLSEYLKKHIIISNKLPGISPRSITIDKNNNIWIGSRNNGVHIFKIEQQKLIRQFYLDQEMGLSDNFITKLVCDRNNDIWACSPSGLDKISIINGIPVIENITKQNNIYQSVSNVVFDKTNNAWASLHSSIIKITPDNRQTSGYSPSLLVSMIISGKDTIKNENGTILSHKQNNLSFYFAATSFLDEKQVQYSYRLQGSSNSRWSEPSNNSIVSYTDLHPGEYVFEIKATFPAGRYSEKMISYNFSINPPWWQTWWFRCFAGILVIGLLLVSVRFYYRRKLEKQKAVLEKQQAIEKERTRIATDMHDDLGAGLSRIKFLSENMKANKGNDEAIMEDVKKISAYSNEMAEKMGEIVWALNQKNDTVADLVAFTRSYTLEYLSGLNIQCDMDTPLVLPALFIPGEMRQHIFLSVKECLHNIVKHAGATRVYFSIKLDDAIEIIIHDNGKGINWNELRTFSNGIQNIRKRMSEINGKVVFENKSGTRVVLSIPFNV